MVEEIFTTHSGQMQNRLDVDTSDANLSFKFYSITV